MTKRKDGTFKLYIVWAVVFVAVALITLTYQRESTSFYGIAETRESKINSKVTVDIMKISVKEGQIIEEGTLLVELSSPEMTLKINEISHQIEQLKAEKGISKSEIRSSIRELQAQRASVVSDINYRIKQLENKYKINKNLSSGLKSLKKKNSNSGSNPIQLQIAALKDEMKLSVSPMNIKISLLRKELKGSGDPIKIRLERLDEELKLLSSENSKLNIYSQTSGIVGSVNFKAGEKVAPFVPILTVHQRTPSFVKGYLHENVYTKMKVGDKVNVISAADNSMFVEGIVMGVGAKIVEYPVRLRKHPDIAMWGRELIIKIPEDNSFILGEKVLISSVKEDNKSVLEKVRDFLGMEEVQAATLPVIQEEESLPKSFKLSKDIEASEVIYLADIDRYLILNDDTDKKVPELILCDSLGNIESTLISGLKKINDMESGALANDGSIFIASSLSHNKKEKLKNERKLLLKVKRDGKEFKLDKKVLLYDILVEYAKNNDSETTYFLNDSIKNKTLDIEGIFFKEDNLYLGVKAPLLDGSSVILEIVDIDTLIKNETAKKGSIRIWKTIKLKDGSGIQKISGMFLSGNDLFITGTTKKDGGLWKLNTSSKTPDLIKSFKDLRPEGVSRSKNDNIVLAFDQGSELSQIRFIRVKK